MTVLLNIPVFKNRAERLLWMGLPTLLAVLCLWAALPLMGFAQEKANTDWRDQLRERFAQRMAQKANQPLTTPDGFEKLSMDHGGLTRWFLIHTPPGLKPNDEPVPLVMLLHGGAGNMSKMVGDPKRGTAQWVGKAQSEGFILIVPNGVSLKTGQTDTGRQAWNDLRPPPL
jgi:poly(3-hydroxybutyrate) depolymerase